MKRIVLASLALCVVSGCTWVKLDDAGAKVRVAYDGRVEGCVRKGEVGVSVKDRVGVYERNDLKVKDELETLARNEAVGLQADTLVALGEPHNGEQRFAAYQCGSAPRQPASPPNKPERSGAETYPVR